MSPSPRPTLVIALLLALGIVSMPGGNAGAQGQPDGQITIAFDAAIASSFLDPAETVGLATPFAFLYALHDALIKPLPGNDMAPCLAESWRESPDGLTYEFKLRQGVRFHNGDPVTAEDVKFSFQRYRGVSAKLLHDRVRLVEVVDPQTVRFVLHRPWPDFLQYYATPATGAAWIVPRKYIEKVGEDGFGRQPVGAGPYKFVRMTPGIELVLEANEQYWRKKPSIKRVVFKGVPDRSTRLAMLKTGEADIGYLMVGVEAATIKADPKLRLASVIPSATWWMEFLDAGAVDCEPAGVRDRLFHPYGPRQGDAGPDRCSCQRRAVPPFRAQGQRVAPDVAKIGPSGQNPRRGRAGSTGAENLLGGDDSMAGMPPTIGHELPYRADIDGLRAISVGLVMAFHMASGAMPGGFVGVDVFFVISGYLISGLILAGLRAGHFTLTGFYVRRIRRILPALFTVVAVTIALGCIVLIPGDLRETARSGLYALFGASNFYFLAHRLLRRHRRDAAVPAHLWSLGVEEQFYLVWPLFLMVLFRLTRGRRGPMALVIAVVVAASFAASLLVLQKSPKHAFYLPFTRAWQLGLGALLTSFPPSAVGGGTDCGAGAAACRDGDDVGGRAAAAPGHALSRRQRAAAGAGRRARDLRCRRRLDRPRTAIAAADGIHRPHLPTRSICGTGRSWCCGGTWSTAKPRAVARRPHWRRCRWWRRRCPGGSSRCGTARRDSGGEGVHACRSGGGIDRRRLGSDRPHRRTAGQNRAGGARLEQSRRDVALVLPADRAAADHALRRPEPQ